VTRTRWLLVVAGAGLAIFALSFVNAWIVHDREVRGEGYRYVQYFLSAWRGVGWPVLSAAVLAALVTAGWAVALLRRPSLPAWPLLVGSILVLGLLTSVAAPIAQDGHASSVDLSPGLLWPIGMLLAAAMLAGSVAAAGPTRGIVAGMVVAAVLVGSAGVVGRWAGLQAAEGTGRHWTEGSYTRPATADLPAATLTIGDGTFRVNDRWSGRWEWSGWTVIVDDDPACPDSRGTYHAHGEEEEALRFVMVVDTCNDGARAAEFVTGVWSRVP
jgi:hypothetical protein